MRTLQPTKTSTKAKTTTKSAVSSSTALFTGLTGLIGVAAAVSLQSKPALDVSDVAYQLPTNTKFGDAVSKALTDPQPLTAIHSVMETYGVFCPTWETETIEHQLRAQYDYMLDDVDLIVDEFRAAYVSMLYHPGVNTINNYFNFLDEHGLVDSYEHGVRFGQLQLKWEQQYSTIKVEFSSDGRMVTNTFQLPTNVTTVVNEILDWGTRFMKPESGIAKYSSIIRRLLTDTLKPIETKPKTLVPPPYDTAMSSGYLLLNDPLYQALANPT